MYKQIKKKLFISVLTNLFLDGHDVEELRALETKANVVKTMWKKKTFAKTSFKGLVLR